MNKYELTQSQLATAEAITDSIMDKIGDRPSTDGFWQSIVDPLARAAHPVLHHATKPVHEALWDAGKHVKKFTNVAGKRVHDIDNDIRIRHGKPKLPPRKGW